MNKRKRVVESDIRKFYHDSSQITQAATYLKDFHTRPESWDTCISILYKHSVCTEKITKGTVPVLLHCAITLKLHAYNGFRHQFSQCLSNKYDLICDICERIFTLVLAYSRTHPQISVQLSCVVACIVIYGFDASHSASRLLFLIGLAKTEDGTLPQYLYLSSVAREVMGENIYIHLNHRSSFIRVCISLAPRVFSKLIFYSRQGDISVDHYRISALTEWINLHIYLLKVFYPVILDQKFVESYELVYEDLMLPKKKLSDLELIHRSLNSLKDLNVVEMVLNFIKYGFASENNKIMTSSCELSTQLLCICHVDLNSLLMMANQKYLELLDVKNCDDRWNLACKDALTKFSPLILKITVDLVLGICMIGSSLLVCGELEKKLIFLKKYTSKLVMDLFIFISRKHLPFVLHFGLVKDHYIHNFCRFVNLFMYSDTFSLRKSALDFWDTFQEHLCPPRKDLSYITTCGLENVRSTVVKFIRPCYEYFVTDLYKSCIISDGDDFEALSLYRELVITSLRKALLITGCEYVVKLVRDDLDHLINQFNVHILERCVFFTSAMASSLSGSKEVVKSVIIISLGMIDFKKIALTKTRPVNLYRNSIFRLIFRTSSFICKDDELLDITIKFMLDQIKVTKNTNMPLNAHVYLDKAVLGLCFNLTSRDKTKRAFIDYLSCSLVNYVFPLEKRLEIIEIFNSIVDNVPFVEPIQTRYNMVKGFFYQVCHIKNITEMPESYLLILATMSSINFVNQKEMKLDFVLHVVEFIFKFKDTEDLWRYISEVIIHTTVTDQSNFDFSLNSVQNNKTSFLIWMLSSSKPNFIQLPVIKTLLSQNVIRSRSKLYDVLIIYLTSIAKDYLNMLKSNTHPADQQAIDLLDCFSLIMVKWELVPKLFRWSKLSEFVSVLSNSLPRKLSNLNLSGYSVIAKFVGWADFPKQLIANIEGSNYQIFRSVKHRARSILNARESEDKFLNIIHNIIDAIFRATVSRAHQMESWITLCSQTLSVLIKCSQTLQNTQASLKNIMDERCTYMSPAHVNFYHKKLLQAKGCTDIRIILNIISDYHFSNFTMY